MTIRSSRHRVVARLNPGVRRLIRLRTASMRVKLVATAPIAALLACGVQAAHPGTSPTPVVSLCDLLATSAPLSTVASFQATASTDLHHGITLRDPACPNISLRVVRAEDGADQSVKRFLNRLRVLAPHLTWRSARGSFTGRTTLDTSGEQRVALLAAHDFQEVTYEP